MQMAQHGLSAKRSDLQQAQEVEEVLLLRLVQRAGQEDHLIGFGARVGVVFDGLLAPTVSRCGIQAGASLLQSQFDAREGERFGRPQSQVSNE